MLKLTRKVEYALIALRHMQDKAPELVSSTKEIATQYNIPPVSYTHLTLPTTPYV